MTGRAGEETAAVYLRSLGYSIYAQNVRVQRDEIDIIAYDPHERVLVFAEVKTRSVQDADFSPELNITSAKKKKLQRSSRYWIAEHAFEGGYRIDVITVVGDDVADHFHAIDIDPVL